VHHVITIVVDADTRVTNGFLSHRPSSLHLLTTWVRSTTLPPQARLMGSVCAAEIDGDDHTHRSEADDGGYDDVELRSSPR